MHFKNSTFSRLACLALVCIMLAACAKRPTTEYTPLSESKGNSIAKQIDITKQGLTSWNDLAPALDNSIAFVSKKPASGIALQRDILTVTWGELRAGLLLMRNLLPQLDADPTLLGRHFRFIQITQDPKFTSYYEPAIEADLSPSSVYAYPIYAQPDDLQSVNLTQFHPRFKGQTLYYRIENGKVVPYFHREDIDSDKKLANKGLEIAWAKDPVDIFFLQVQGSGRLILPDGQEKHVLYAGKNGHQYVSLGRVMKEAGLLDPDNVSMQSIRDYLNKNPHKMQELLNTNPSYVFFRLADKGPIGAINQALTARVSLATDPQLLPLGGLLAFTVPLPEKGPEGAFRQGSPFTGIGLAQDTGGAIKGHRLDFFSGYGDEATWVAGHMNTPGSVWLMLPRIP
ncbi:murein transglycosylase A [Desulfovibrio mangrovi]|uniref:murein transglycosylase A n=1 Tax=Desulfovibrio mangrovi TaxID=2976983 RepID=UPI002247ED1E|nr:murein transglycosylase A [Desulfovibrio mangrovi]UZP68856.1 murein transglycosylase A [Desulfovibrio mangrovi]